MRLIGRLLQIVGLVVLPLSMLMQLTGGIGLREMLMMLAFGVAAFYLGRFAEGFSHG
jgi:hypothetical protein